ncbi:unnamed protein product [Phytophthora fragariaefolia]|uniref:Unnamed protein product n=1 Tax=Phytophthora fragariaefolia TaxID=1490495 RepID=A0A9W7D1R6_9STRA|nr:unnamed protein product [Phytophthora fragariaefolia]
MTLSQAAAAQAAAEAAEQATMQGPEPHDNVSAIVEVRRVTTAPTLIEVVPDATDQLVNLAERFLAQTQALAGEHVMLKFQQEGPNQAQQAALVGVQGYAESRLNELANRQLVIVQEFQGELASIRSTFQEQRTRLQNLHADLGAQLEVKAHTDLANQIEHTVNTKIEAINNRVQKKIMEQLTSRLGPNPSKDVEQLVLKSTADMESRIRASGGRRIEKLHTSKLDARNERHISENVNDLVHKLVETSVSNMAHRLEQSIDLRLDEIRQEKQCRLDSNCSSDKVIADDIQQFLTQETTRLVGQVESRMQKVVTAARVGMNLQVQRQVDTISVLREQLQQRQQHLEGDILKIDALERKLKEFVVDEVVRQVDSPSTTLNR